MGESIDALVRRADEDRWLASRFASASARERLVALYAVNHEISRTRDVVREPGIGLIRLAWWRDAVAAVAAGKPPLHPSLEALAQTGGIKQAELAHWERLIEGCSSDFVAAPEGLAASVAATAGGLMRLALSACDVPADACGDLEHAALAWGMLEAARLPAGSGEDGCNHQGLMRAARDAHAAFKGFDLPASAFPALGYVALVPGYVRAFERGERFGLFSRQCALVWASARGRL